MSDLPHLRIDSQPIQVPYTYAGGGRSVDFRLPPRDRFPHAQKLKADLNRIELQVAEARVAERLADEGPGQVITVRSDSGFDLKLESLERRPSRIELLSVKMDGDITVAKVFVPAGKLDRFASIIESYETKQSPQSGRPRNRELVESIASIQLAVIEDFWQDTIQIPVAGQEIWWEIWLRADPAAAAVDVYRRFLQIADQQGLLVSENYVAFPERVVTLAYGDRGRLSGSFHVLAMIAELRKAKELATDYVGLAPRDQGDVVDELVARIQAPAADAPSVCLLDSGVNRDHPLIAIALQEGDTQSVRASWGTGDAHHQHGTKMAGIAIYGSLTEIFPTVGPISLTHCLESVKFLPPPPAINQPKDYGPFTEQAIARAEIQAPTRNRSICMAVTADDRDFGLPSLWSATVDQLCAGARDGTRRLIFISAGNLRDEIFQADYQYHRSNCQKGGIEDPAQSWNAITVGAYTEKVVIEQVEFRGWRPLAESGDLCPTSRTSLAWPTENHAGWPIKPDIVMEGGNYAQDGANREALDDLSLLTTVLPGGPLLGRLLETVRDTSPATALAARLAAQIWAQYPNLEPETVRALIVHSARWTPKMIERFPGMTRASIQDRLRCYGYGVPDLQRAKWSAENAATLIFEGSVRPFHKIDGDVRSNEMHVHRLPWPVQVLEQLGEAQVTLRITLSYFIEPSPGRIGWTRKHRYQSHGLRFELNRPQEDEPSFRQRLSRQEWEDDERPDNAAETRNWVVGDQGRRHGSVHSDSWTGLAADLATTNLVAVYPVTGWWRERDHLGKFDKEAHYSLIVSLESADETVDLYSPIVARTPILTAIAR